MTIKSGSTTVVAAVLVLLLASCGGETATEETAGLSQYFPEKLATADLERNSSVDTYVGDSLYAYINGGAELYHEYGFDKVSTASYVVGEENIILDIYQFDDALGAFGLFSRLRPDWPEPANLGVESFASPTSIDFVKGDYLVRLTSFSENQPLAVAMQALAQTVEQKLPGTVDPPSLLAKFPDQVEANNAGVYYAGDYLGHGFLDQVYLRDYQWGEKEFTLFLTEDPGGEKVSAFAGLPDIVKSDSGPFPESESLVLDDSYYGRIVVTSTGGYLIGIVNFTTGLEQLLAEWSSSLKH